MEEERAAAAKHQLQIDSSKIAVPVVVEDWLYKVAFLSVATLIQLIVIVANYGYPITNNWGALFIPVWIVLGAILIYFAVRCYRAVVGEEKYHHPVVYLMFFFLLWVAAIVFFILLAIQLNQYATGAGTIDGVQLVDVWLIFSGIFSFVSITYMIWRCCNRNEIMSQRARLVSAVTSDS